jgi:hypothetical protein
MPGQGSLDSDIRAGDEKIANLLFPCIYDRGDLVHAWEFNKNYRMRTKSSMENLITISFDQTHISLV